MVYKYVSNKYVDLMDREFLLYIHTKKNLLREGHCLKPNRNKYLEALKGNGKKESETVKG